MSVGPWREPNAEGLRYRGFLDMWDSVWKMALPEERRRMLGPFAGQAEENGLDFATGRPRQAPKQKVKLARPFRQNRGEVKPGERVYLQQALRARLTERDRAIVEWRLAGAQLAEIGAEYEVTRQRVHQILKRAMEAGVRAKAK